MQDKTPKDVILIMGSDTDADKANEVLKIWKAVGVNYRVAIASCHRHSVDEFAKFILSNDEKLIVFLGGMSLAAPGLIETILKKADKCIMVFAIPTDKAAQSAIEDLPKGTAIITSGLNQVSLLHSLVNSALATAKLVGMFTNKQKIFNGLKEWYEENLEKKPLIPCVVLNDDGTILQNK